MTAAVIIPARYGSTRFPGKPLANIGGVPLIQHVYEGCVGARLVKEVVVATDAEEIRRAVRSFGGKAVLTSPTHPSGTDRVAEAAARMEYDIIVNVQGDEPLIRPELIDLAVRLLEDQRASVGTLMRRIKERRAILDPNVVKVAVDGQGFAVYFSRSPIPYHRDRWRTLGEAEGEESAVFQHIGLYSYRKEALLRLAALKPTVLEEAERLEQLRALEHGLRIKVAETDVELIGVDTPEDIERVEKWLSSSS